MALDWDKIQGRTSSIKVTTSNNATPSKLNWDKIQNRGEYSAIGAIKKASNTDSAKETYRNLMNATEIRSYDEAQKTIPPHLPAKNQEIPYTNSNGTFNPFALTQDVQKVAQKAKQEEKIRKINEITGGQPTAFVPMKLNVDELEEAEKVAKENIEKNNKLNSIVKTPEIMKDNLRRFEDGYNFGDVTKTGLETVGDTALTVAGTVGDVGLNVAKGVLSVPENMAKAGASAVAGVADFVGADDWANNIRRNVAYKNIYTDPTQKAIDFVDKASIAGTPIDTIASGVGQVGGTVAVSKVLGKAGMDNIKIGKFGMPVTAVLQGAGSGATEAYQKTDAGVGLENMTWREKAQNALKIVGSGVVAGMAEGAFGTFGVGENPFTQKISNALVAKASTPLTKVLTKMGFSGFGEAAEEFVEYLGNYALDNKIVNKIGSTDFSSEFDGKQVIQEMLSSFIVSALTQGGTSSIQMRSIANQQISQIEKELGRKLTPNEIKQVANNIADQLLIESEQIDVPKSAETEQIETTSKDVLPAQENQNNIQYSLNEQSSIRRSANNFVQKGWKIPESTIQTLESIQNKREGLTIEFDDTIKGNGVYNVNEDGTRSIKINPNSQRAIEFTMTHELAHDLKAGDKESYQELQNFVLKYAKSFKDYDSATKVLGETYAKQLGEGNFVLNDEATNDIVAQAIGNQDFLNTLAQEQPNVFVRAYNWVKNVLLDGKKTGLTFEERKFLNELQNKFRVAYEQTFSRNEIIQPSYSIGGQLGMQNAINNDFRFKRLQDNLTRAQTMAKQGVDNEIIRQNTNWFQDKNGEWKFEFSDEYMKLKPGIKLQENNTYKLKDVLEHDLLFEFYPELAEYDFVYKSLNKKINGLFSRRTNKIFINTKLKDNVAIEGTLIHEIQHAIQKIEDFKKDKYSRFDKLGYRKSIQEIEAADTKERFLKEKDAKQNFNRDLIPPESSKMNPKHPTLDDYLNKRKIRDKIRDGIFQYFREGGWLHDSEVEKNNFEHSGQDSRKNRYMEMGRGRLEGLDDSSSFSLNRKNNSWQSFLDKNFDLMPKAIRNMPQRIIEQEKQSSGVPEKIATVKTKSYERSTTNKFIKNVLEKMQTTKFGNMNEFRSITNAIVRDIKNESLTKEKINQYANVIYDAAVRINSNFYDENKNIKADIRKKRIYASEDIVKSFEDWNEFRRNNFGVLNLTNLKDGENIISVSDLYKNLSQVNSQLFPDSIETTKEQLTRISEVAKSIRKIEERASKNLEETFGKEIRESTIYKIKEDISELTDGITRVENLERENASKEKTKQELLNTVIDVEEQKKLYVANQNLQKDYEKILRKELLTDRDRIALDRIVKGEIEEGDLTDKLNKKAILNLYPIKKQIEDNKKLLEKAKKAKKAQRYEVAELLTDNSSTWKDKRALGGFRYSTETAERNFYDIIPDNQEAKAIIDEYFAPIHKNEATVIREQNKIKNEIRNLNIDIKPKYVCSDSIRTKISELLPEGEIFTDEKLSEDALVQLYGEKIINEADIKNLGADFNKIHRAAETFRKIYDSLFEQVNDSRIRNGYAPVEFRKDYFPHFTENKPDTVLKKIANTFGIETSNQELPTDLAGQTHLFKPGIKWSANFLQRKGNKTDYSALKGMDNYLNTALDVIYHTDDIQNLRVLDDVIRYKYSEKGIQEQIDEVRDRVDIDDRQKNALLNDLYNTDTTEFSHLVTWLRGYTDNISGKKSIEDRNMEHQLGRNMYTTMKNLEGRVASNMIGMNVNSALTNIIPIIQGSGEIKTKNLLKALYYTSRNSGKSDGFVNDSDFLVNRRGTDRLYKTFSNKLSDASGALMSVIDEFSSEILVRAKYYDNLDNGMSSELAMKNANEFAASVMGDRSKGAMPTIFNTKNPIAKTFTMFQLEVNNQFRYLFKDIPRNLADEGLKAIAGALFKVFLGSWLYGELKEEVTGQRSVFDPIDIVSSSIKEFVDPETSIGEDVYNSASKIAKELPFIGGLLGGGRIPISSALPELENTVVATSGLITGEMDREKAAKTLVKELGKPLYYLLFPTAGGQLKKTYEGISTVAKGGEYGVDSQGNKQLKFAVDTSQMSPLQKAGTYARAGLFGKYSLPSAQEYVNSGFKQLSANRTKGYEQAKAKGIPAETYLEINESVKKIEPDNEKWMKNERKSKIIDIIESYNLTDVQKAYLYNVFYKNEYEEGS